MVFTTLEEKGEKKHRNRRKTVFVGERPVISSHKTLSHGNSKEMCGIKEGKEITCTRT
jgi:hypothetical protein